MTDLERLRRLLGKPALAGLRARLRKRYEQGRQGGVVTLSRLNAEEMAALCGLLGRPVTSAESLRFAMDDLDAVLLASGAATSLRQALELLDGPIENLAARREAMSSAWRDLFPSLIDERLVALLSQPRAFGALRRASGGSPDRARQLCADAGRVLAALPCESATR